jgi:hypothetical protein
MHSQFRLACVLTNVSTETTKNEKPSFFPSFGANLMVFVNFCFFGNEGCAYTDMARLCYPASLLFPTALP